MSGPIKKGVNVFTPPLFAYYGLQLKVPIDSLIRLIRQPLKVGDIPQEERYQQITGQPSFHPPSEAAQPAAAGI